MIKSITVQNLRGSTEPSFTVTLNHDLNIITGKNGSGKTTLLKLIWYLISGNIHRAIVETPFSYATIELNEYSMSIDISDPDHPEITVDRFGEERIFKKLSVNELDEHDMFELDDEDPIVEAGGFTEDFGQSLYFPTFRRVEGGYTIPRSNSRRVLATQNRRASSIEDAFSEISRRLSNMGHRFICSVSTDDIVQLVLNKYNSINEQYSSSQQKLSAELISEIRAFQDKSSVLPMSTAEEVLNRIKNAIEQVDQQRASLMQSLNAVQSIVISLFNKKSISFEDRYSFGEKTNAILSEHLSAGEKQILSFICYNAFYDNTTIFIDEPELSLHVDWQRQLFPILEAQSSTNQFIIATHSPFIYSKYPEKEIVLNDRGD